MNTAEMSYNDLAGDLGAIEWIVNATVEGEKRRFSIQACSEQSAVIQIEDLYADVLVTSAYPAKFRRCPICAGLNCKRPHDA